MQGGTGDSADQAGRAVGRAQVTSTVSSRLVDPVVRALAALRKDLDARA